MGSRSGVFVETRRSISRAQKWRRSLDHNLKTREGQRSATLYTCDPTHHSRSMATRLSRPGAYTVVDAEKVLRDDDGVVAIVQTANELAADG